MEGTKLAPLLIDILAYREWAIQVFQRTLPWCMEKNYDLHLHQDSLGYCHDADLTFLVGWSELVREKFYKDRIVLVAHPSPLPKYRGGSPIQHQILAGETRSAVTLFKLDVNYPEVDSGPIYKSISFSLDGDLSNILQRITARSVVLIEEAIKEYAEKKDLRLIKQVEEKATVFKRRKPEESEITITELQSLTAQQLYDKIRALQDPYPNAFITASDGSKLYLTQAHL